MMAQNTTDDKELVQAAQSGRMEAFTLLYERYLPMVYNRVRYTIPTQDVEDVTQEVFIAVIKSIKSFRGEAQFGTWLRTITNRQISDYYRHRPRATLDLDENMGAPHNPAALDNTIMLHQAFRALPDKYREILLLRFAEGLKFQEIAQLLGQSLEAVKSLFRRAVAALNKRVKSNA